MSSRDFREEISHIMEEHEFFMATEEKPEDVATNLENLKIETKREVRDTRRKSLDNTVNNVISNLQTENNNLYALTQNKKSIIDCEFLNTDNRKYVPSSSVTKELHVRMTVMERKVSQIKARHSIDKPRNFNHLLDSNKQNEQQIKRAIGNKSYLDRVMLNSEKKKYENEIRIIRKMNKEQSELYSKPELSKMTKEIIKKRNNNDQPLYKRTKEILLKKQVKLEELKKNISEGIQEVTPVKCAPYDKERNDKWISDKLEWKKKVNNKVINNKKIKEIVITETENYIYRPTINKLSETIANFKNSETPDKTIYDRLYDKKDTLNQTMIELERNLCPSFNPVLNKPAKKGKVDINRSMIETRACYDPILTKYTTKENKRLKSQEPLDEYTYVNPDKHWTRVIEDVNMNTEWKEKENNLYKINVQSSSAWDKDHLNVIMLNNRMIELFNDNK
jgi:hypothetical protein